MRVQIVSDLHLDHSTLPPEVRLAEGADVVVCAGDVCEGGGRAMRWLRTIFPNPTPIVAVLGNHEHYGGCVSETLQTARLAASDHNVHLLENSAVDIGGVLFWGATMWTDFALYGEDLRQDAMEEAARSTSDYRQIRMAGRPPRRLAPSDTLRAHRESVERLSNMIGRTRGQFVVTHHGPHPKSVAAEFGTEMLNAAFSSDLGELIYRLQPAYWVHGHTHHCHDYELPHIRGSVRVICNPRGYGNENPAFDPQLTIEV